MKKIIIMSVAIMAAVVVNAAASSWSNTGAVTASIKNGTAVWNTLAADGTATAYLLLATDQAAFKASLDNGTFGSGEAGDSLSKAIASTTTVNNKGRISNVAIDIPEASTAYSMVFVYEDKTTGNTWYQFSSAAANATGSDDPMVLATPASFAVSSFSASGWTEVAASVPEPTSGLLLLLGMAGLALRRKKA